MDSPEHEPHSHNQAQSTAGGYGSYAFLNHSSITLPNNLPPSVDDKPLARQKRRRTSPEDQAVLEAAYHYDPKPDKEGRLALIKQIALGEKEVQIWFQNRRQTSRRKSRPLLPHEIEQYQLARGAQLPPPSEASSSVTLEDARLRADGIIDLSQDRGGFEEHRSSKPDAVDLSVSHDVVSPLEAASLLQSSRTSTASGSHPNSSPHGVASVFEGVSTDTQKVSVMSIGYLANRRSAPSLRIDQVGHSSAPQPRAHPASDQPLRKASSFVRLAMTSGGSAAITTKDVSSPSPPRPSQGSQTVNAISYGALADSKATSSAGVVSSVKPGHRTSSGRSRDSRAWEFWCDKDTRGELEDKAEKDASGSATGAIELLRSSSGRRILGSIPSKRNSGLSSRPSLSKRSKSDPAPRQLQRSSTSLGRLQGKQVGNTGGFAKPAPKLKHFHSAASVYIPGNDSDKENWSPETETYSERGTEKGDPHLHSHPLTAARNTNAKDRRARDPSKAHTKTGHEPASTSRSDNLEEDPEIAAFMRAGEQSSSIAEEQELDCVQGLLSLSQGNWR